MPEEIFYFDKQHKRVSPEQASYFITLVTDESGKVLREQIGIPEKRNQESKLIDAMGILSKGKNNA